MSASPPPPRSSAPPPRATSSRSTWRPRSTARSSRTASPHGVDYTIGSGELLEGIDEAVTGLEAGGEATFTSELKGGSAAGKEAEVTVKVTEVAARELPELDDDFAQMASEFDTLEELREDSRKRLGQQKQYDQATAGPGEVLDDAPRAGRGPRPGEAARGRGPAPASTTWSNHQLGQMGLDLAKYLRDPGQDRGGVRRRDSRSRPRRASRPSSSSTSSSTRRS